MAIASLDSAAGAAVPTDGAADLWPDGPPAFQNLVRMFDAAAARRPDAPCVVFRGEVWSYRAIAAWSRAIAAAISGRTRPGDCCAVVLERGPGILAAILGVLRQGHPFVPVDGAHVAERSRQILSDARPALVLTDRPDSARAELGIAAARVLTIDAPGRPMAPRCYGSGADPEAWAPAYIAYTSGSTGRPKGVICSHAGICNLADVHHSRFQLSPGSRVLAAASIGFDASIAELFMAVRAGAALVMADAVAQGCAASLASLMRAERVTHALLTPTVLAALPEGEFPDLELVSAGGETVPQRLIDHWAPRIIFENAYGPTEASVEVSHWRFAPGDHGARIGRPIRNARFAIGGPAAPPAEEGELWIGGPMVALGYLGRPDLTFERFMTCARTGRRYYRTGDRVRRVGPDVYDFLGRVDDQVKSSGVRIEPEEVRAAIEAVPGVAQAAVAVDRAATGATLIGFYRPSRAGLDRALVVEELARRLPPSMIPGRLVEVDSMPLRTSGKIDVEALRQRERATVAGGRPVPKAGVAAALIGLWQKLLNVPKVGLDDNFFALGGNSLRLTQLIFAINKTYRIRLTPVAFRALDDLGSLIAHIEGAPAAEGRPDAPPGGA